MPKKSPEVSVEKGEPIKGSPDLRKVKLSVDPGQGCTSTVVEAIEINPELEKKDPTAFKKHVAQLTKDGYVNLPLGAGKTAPNVFIKKSDLATQKDTFANKDTTYHDVLNGGAGKKAPAQCALTLVGAKDPKSTGAAPKSGDLTTPPEWFKGDCVRVRDGQVVNWYPIVPAKDGVKVTFKGDKSPDQEVYLSPKDAADYYARVQSGTAGNKAGNIKWMFYRKTNGVWETTDKAPPVSKS